MKIKKLSEAVIALSITIALLLLLTSPLWIGWMMEHEHNKTLHAVADVALQCPEGAMENREVWSKLGIAIFCEKDGVKHGMWQAWDGGYMHIAGEFMHGDKHGIWKYFNAHGEQWGTRSYNSGKEISGLVNLLIADLLVLKKNEGRLYLVKNSKQYRSYGVYLPTERPDHDQKPGNERIPQGKYILNSKHEDSEGRKSIHASYSNEQSQKSVTKTGFEFTIFGQPKILGWIWQRLGFAGGTKIRIAVSHQDLDEIWSFVEKDIPIQVLP